MIYLPPLRRLLLPALIVLALTVFYKSSLRGSTSFPPLALHGPDPPSPDMRIPIADLKHHLLPVLNRSSNHLSPPKEFYYTYNNNKASSTDVRDKKNSTNKSSPAWTQPALNPSLQDLFKCPTKPNRYTNHIRLPHIIRNISMVPPSSQGRQETRSYFNPTIISLPYWSENQYLIVVRILTIGTYQENVLCEANICEVGEDDDAAEKGKRMCTEDDIVFLGPAGGMRCATEPIVLSVPPTPAEHCEGKMLSYADIPGFHDPRIFWSGRGEPLMMLGSQSRYACFGLWVIDLRALYPPLEKLLASSPNAPSLGPLMSYATLTELTRNPASSRSAIEKNWLLFFTEHEAYVHYEIDARSRSFAKLLGAGLTTTNLTDPLEPLCLATITPNHSGSSQLDDGTWHQATNSLRLVLCARSSSSSSSAACVPAHHNTVFLAVVQRKQHNYLALPMRYDRYLVVWSAAPPFHLLAVSQHPLLLANETASGWSAKENWADAAADDDDDGDDVAAHHRRKQKDLWAYFTYTVSMAYAWGRPGDELVWKNTGFLDDEILLGIGIDDHEQGFARVPARELLQCLKACPGPRKEG
ncbi:MAG: hypothetical protein M1816_008050 [Peltula sp. TS41687]|nr:MAG: hypothetical protein M1816_008050 [Peltula sp. TS41687]